jgi:hypothetical protein
MSKADKIKKIIKGECAKPTFGTNPSDPWSAKAGLAESEASLLKKFLLSRGINPGFVPKDTKIAHSKSGEFKKWKMDHQNIGEEMSQEPSPTQKRLGDLKSSANKHKEIRTTAGTHEKLHKEETNVCEECGQDPCACSHGFSQQIDEISKQTLTGYVHSAISDRNKTDAKMMDASAKNSKEFSKRRHSNITKLLDKSNKRSAGIEKALHRLNKEEVESLDELDKSTIKRYKDKAILRQVGHASNIYDREVEGGKAPDPEQHRKLNKVKAGIARADVRLNKEETLDEVSSELLGRYKEKAKKSADELHSQEKYGKAADRQMNIMKATGKQIQHTTKAIAKSLNKEDAYQDSQAATQMPFDGGNDPSETPVSSKTAKVMAMVKKHKMVKEDLYDHEKDDKPAQTTKKPKVVQQQQDGYGRSTNDAAIVMTGGKTMTGETRDTIEIDPMLKKPKGGDLNPPNGSENKADNKKENK